MSYNDIYSRLSIDSLNDVEGLRQKGWTFEDAEWYSGHNGDVYSDIKAKSPNIDSCISISEREWSTITADLLLEREASEIAREWVSSAFEDSDLISGPVTSAVRKHLLKTRPVSMEQLCSDNVSVKVALSPKLKVRGPKKVKITVEIL